MRRGKLLAFGVCALLGLSIACGKESSTPLAPKAVTPAVGDEVAGADGSTLKVSAPGLVSPINGVELAGSTATLIATAATGKYTGATALSYDFELFDATSTKIRTEVVNGLSWVVAGLAYDATYKWRVRATTDSTYGPWSGFGSFKTPANTGYIKGNELFDPLFNGQTVATAMRGATFVPGQGIRLEAIDSFVEYRLGATLTDGEFSVIVTNIRNSNEQWKTKIFSMLQDDGVNITDNSYRFTADRRNRDSSGTVRYTLRSRGVDAGEPNCGSASWDITHIYLWTFTWRGGSSNLTVRDGGPNGPVVRSCGANYKTPYAPNPHLIRLGSVDGRAGSETLPQAIFRNVWVSSAPRPVLLGDTP